MEGRVDVDLSIVKKESVEEEKGETAADEAVQSTTDDSDALPHQEAMKRVHDIVATLIQEDPLLRDLPAGVTLEEVNSAIAVEYGQAMIVNVFRADGVTLKVTVIQEANVRDLKRAIQRHVTLRQSRRGGTTHISWKYIWRNYWLYYNGTKLTQDEKCLKAYGIRNRDEVSFIKKLKKKRRP